MPSGSAATTDSKAAPAGRRVLAPAVRLAIAIVYAAWRRQKVSRPGFAKAGLNAFGGPVIARGAVALPACDTADSSSTRVFESRKRRQTSSASWPL